MFKKLKAQLEASSASSNKYILMLYDQSKQPFSNGVAIGEEDDIRVELNS